MAFDPLGATPSQWEALAQAWSLPAYRGRQIFDALHRRGRRAYEDVRELPAGLRERLTRGAPLSLPEIARREASADGSLKYGLRLSDGALIEAVFMPGRAALSEANEFEDARARRQPGPQDGLSVVTAPVFRHADPSTRTGRSLPTEGREEPCGAGAERGARDQPSGRGRIRPSRSPVAKPDPSRSAQRRDFTVCLSSQTGCAVDCAFCVTGRLGGGRNLSAGEIVGQLYAVLDDVGRKTEGLRVVFMGMGEPFLNPDGVSAALDVLFEILSPRRVTVSTSGITPAFSRFAHRERRPNLAVSINAADSETRTRLMPITRTYPLEGVLAAMREWPLESHRRITAEYVLIAGVNDSPEDATRLARRLSGLRVKVNAIPLNEDPVYLPGWRRPREEAIDLFASRLSEAGVPVTIRRSRGPDAKAACGQLKGRTVDPRGRESGIGNRESTVGKRETGNDGREA
jgi:23S rRNA (adenine2503-C2)-methyltransferase